MTISSVGAPADPVPAARVPYALQATRLVFALLLATSVFLLFSGRETTGDGLARTCAGALPLAAVVMAVLQQRVPATGVRFSLLAATWMVAGALVGSLLWLLPGVQLLPRPVWATGLAALVTTAPALVWAVRGLGPVRPALS